ncbi:MAG: beta family protein, partial [Planctomycetota bacterium]
MLHDALYVPVLRWKQAEKDALQWLHEEDKSRVMPLLEIIPHSFQAKDGGPSTPVRAVLATIAQDIETYWGSSPVFVDVDHVIRAGIREPSGSHLLEVLAEEARSLLPLFPGKSNLVPVTGLSRSEDYQNAVSSIVEEDKTGACLRITPREVSRAMLADKLETLLSRLRMDIVDADLLVDYQAPNASHPDLETLCTSLPQLSKWRSFILLIG